MEDKMTTPAAQKAAKAIVEYVKTAKKAGSEEEGIKALAAIIDRELNQWQDIATAPKDGEYFISYDDFHHFIIFDMKYSENGTLMTGGTRWSGQASKWMPRPNGPYDQE